MTTLRRETHALHVHLETLLGLPTAIHTVDQYRSVLQQFYGFYRPMEYRIAQIGTWRAIGLDCAQRRKLPFLAADLAQLGVSLRQRHALPRAALLPFSSRGAAFGAFYVLEGATLGGQRIAPVLASLDAGIARSTAFFANYGERTGVMWHEFRGALSGFAAAQPDAAEAIIQGARATFLAFAAWIESGDRS